MYSQVRDNKRKSILLMTIFVAIISLISYLISLYFNNADIFYYACVFSLIYAVIQYFFAAAQIRLMTNGQEIQRNDAQYRHLYNLVETVAIAAGLPMPKVYIVPNDSPNAFASGRNPEDSSVSVTTGLLNILTDRELKGVIAHEMSHIRHYDIRLNMVIFGLTAAISALSNFALRSTWINDDNDRDNRVGSLLVLVGVILAPLAGLLTQMSVSRKREFMADAGAVQITGDGDGLANALEKIGQSSATSKMETNASMSSMYIHVSDDNKFMNLFSTHPPITERIKKLRKMKDIL